MNCEEARQHWHLFHDSEGDAAVHLQINEHLEMCSECARWFFEQSQIEDSITQKLKETATPTAALWSEIERRVTPVASAKSRNWMLLGSAFAGLAVCIVLITVLNGWWRQGDDLAQLSVVLHEDFVAGREEMSFVSSSPTEVEDYLRRQVGFPVRCPPREDAGFEVRGGGACRLGGDPAAYVVGQVDGEDVSVLIFSKDSLSRFPKEQAELRKRAMHRCRMGDTEVVMKQIDRNLVLVVGRVQIRRLERVLDAYGSYGHGTPAHGQRNGSHRRRS